MAQSVRPELLTGEPGAGGVSEFAFAGRASGILQYTFGPVRSLCISSAFRSGALAMRQIHLLCVVVLLAFAGLVHAEIDSGPKAGEKVMPLKVHAVIGAVEDKEVDYVGERKGKPTVYLFVNAATFDRPIARYLRELDKAVGAIGKDVYVVAIWLSEDKKASQDYLPRMNKSIKLENTALTCSLDGAAGPADWAINERAHLTAIVVTGGKVVERFAYQSTNDTDVPKVEAVIKKMVEEKK